MATVINSYDNYIKYTSDNLEFSGYYYHHNRNPFYFLFIRKDKNIYIEIINVHTKNNKYVVEIVMPFDVMAKNECLKKYYDMSVMLANNSGTIYYDTYGVNSKQLISTYDTDSEDDENENEKKTVNIRHWCISSNFVWKNLRLSKTTDLNCYYNINPFEFEYNINTEKEIDDFMLTINSFAKYNCISSIVESEITTYHNNKCIMESTNA
jgi:hypothetical protein